MIIQKMNNVLIKHGKICFSIFTFVIIVSFVWFFTPGVDGSLLFGRQAGSGSQYGSVLGTAVTIGDVGKAREIVALIRGASMGMSPERVGGIDENDAFQIAAMLKAADLLHVQAADTEVVENIRLMPAFQKDGVFSNELYTKYRDLYLSPSGLRLEDVEDAVRAMVRIQKLPYLTAENTILSDGELETELKTMLETISFRLILFDGAPFEKEIKPEEQEAENYYLANKSEFMSEPEFDGLLAYAPFTETRKEVTEEQLRDYFDVNSHEYMKEDGTEAAFDDVKELIRAKLEVTIEQDEAITKAKAFNKSFREAVRKDKELFSSDPQKFFLSEAEKAGLSIQKIENITSQTESDDALHLNYETIRAITALKNVNSYTNLQIGEKEASMFLLTVRRPSEVQPFADVKEEAERRVIAKRAQAMAEEAAASLAVKAAELSDPVNEIEALVTSLKGTIREETKQTRYAVESNPYIPAAKQILMTPQGKLSSIDKNYGFPIFVFINSVTPVTEEEYTEKRDTMREEILGIKQQIAVQGLQSSIFGTMMVLDRFNNNRNAE